MAVSHHDATPASGNIIFCGSCGKPMRTSYHTDARPAYECSSRADQLTTPACRSVAAATVDDAVARVLLDALTPEQVALALSAADEVAGRRQRASRAAELAVERARYDAGRAERAFCAVEPENRLVARSLEARWEARLAVLAEAEQALDAARESLPPLPSRTDLEKLAADLPGLWHAPATSNKDRKRLLRTLIADVTMLPEPDQAKVRIGIRWHTGATDELSAARAVHPGTAKRSPSPAIEMVRQFGPVTPTAELAEQLNAAGLTTGHGRPFDVKAVQWIRHAYNIPAPPVGAENLCHQAIFMNYASGVVTAPDAEVVQVGDAIGQRAKRRGLVQGAVRPVRVVEVLVFAQDGQQMPLIPYQGPVQQLTSAAADPAFHDRVVPHHQLHLIRTIGTSVSG